MPPFHLSKVDKQITKREISFMASMNDPRRGAPGNPRGSIGGHTAGLAPGYVQATSASCRASMKGVALFCERNPKPAPSSPLRKPGKRNCLAR